ncbi:winged helix-turn-helix transcriptional regulator [Streptomyces sp. NPDC048566]|uniref:winged helix-turn-helix transcriptional regulator n=1 Tax=Streptomyces sp. NPDC048566 TaxID=3365569 RepID=UPI00371F6B2D
MTVSSKGVDGRDVGEAMCPYRLVLEHVTSRWGVLVLIELLERPYRFGELRRAVGRVGRQVSEKMLTQTLQTLERDGLVHRDAKPVIPPRVDYSLTELGREAAEQVRGLALWTKERMADVERSRHAYDEARELRDRPAPPPGPTARLAHRTRDA